MQPSAVTVDSFTAIPALNNPATIGLLKEELPAYAARADDVSPAIDELDWWKKNEQHLPH
jgi:hypothetical protein